MSYFYDDEDDDEDDPFVSDEEDQEEQEESSSDKSDRVRKELNKRRQQQQNGGTNSSSSPDTTAKGQGGKGSGTSKGPSGGKAPKGGSPAGGTAGGTPPPATPPPAPTGAALTSGGGAVASSGAAAGTGAAAAGTGAAAAGTGAAAAGAGAAAAGTTAAASTAAVASVAWPVLVAIIIIVIIIILIICLIGVLVFLQTMPGAVMDKLKNMARSVGNAFTSFFGEGKEDQVDPEQIFEVMDYLEEMGYDLKGYGFLTKFVGDDEDSTDDGVERDEDGLISNAESDFINQYIVSDNYMYTIANFNVNTDHWWTALFDHVSSIFTDSLKNRTGMLAIYHDGGTIGSSTEDLYDSLERGYIKADAEAKTLTIKKGWTNNPMKYSLDGWTGRYGMPLEFLLSIHIATMMPDLAYDMATAFDTQIKILLHEENDGAVDGTYKTESGEYVKYETVSEAINGLAGKNIFSSIVTAIDEWGLNNSEAQSLLDLGIVPPEHNPPKCGCELSGDETLYYGEHPVYEDENGYYYEIYEDDESGTSTNVKDIVKVYLEEGQEPVAKTGGSIKKIGAKCKEYLKAAVKYMRKDNDYDYGTYVPYIEKVTDHWYRDVYFIADSNQNLVDYDYDYEAVMRERWTLYETYGTDNPEKMGEYKLYPLKKDGDYASSKDEVYIEDSENASAAKAKIGDDMVFDGSYEDAAKLTIHVAKKATMIKMGDEYEDLNWNEVSSGVYSAYSTEENKTPDYQQLYHEGVEKYDNEESETVKKAMEHIYSAVQIGNVTQTGEGQRAETNPKIKKMFLENRYFRFDGDPLKAEAIVKLREDFSLGYGPLIKDDDTPYTDEELEGMVVEVNRDGDKISDNQEENSNEANGIVKFNARQLSGNVSINQESLDAFTMLENTHTLDADYIYRDFKELIVELGYFEKEELTDETPRVMEFPVPEIGSGGFPNRSIDKKETEYGTMIHSKGDIDANEKNDILAIYMKSLEENDDSGVESGAVIDDENTSGIIDASTSDLSEANKDINSFSAANNNIDIRSNIRGMGNDFERISESGDGYDFKVKSGSVEYTHYYQFKGSYAEKTFSWSGQTKTLHRAACGPTSCINLLTGYGQDVNPSKDIVGISFDATTAGCGKFMEEHGVPGKVIDSANFKSAIEEAFSQGRPIITLMNNGNNNFWTTGGHFVPMIGQDSEGNIITLDPGSSKAERHTYTGGIDGLLTTMKGLWVADEPPSGMKQSSTATYEGYKGNEAVVSPVTGILLEYGTYDPNEETGQDIDNITHEAERVNVDLKYGNLLTKGDDTTEEGTAQTPENGTNEEGTEQVTGEIQSDKVGYAKILVLNSDYYKALESMTNNRWKNSGVSLVNIKQQQSEEGKTIKSYYSDYQGSDLILSEKDQLNDDNLDGDDSDAWPEIDKLVYGYKEFAETYEYAGIGGYIVYIDGFVCEEPDEEFTEEDLKEKVPYEENSSARDEAKISLDRYKEITENIISSDSEDDAEKLMTSLYESPADYKMASQKATDKLNAELAVKSQAASSIYIPNVKIDDETKDAIFIKEGTILGRTMTDRELITEIREQDEEKLKEYRPSYFEEEVATGGSSGDDEEEEPQDKVMGNYIRVIMRDLDDTALENVEDYMKLDEGNGSVSSESQPYVAQPGDLELLANLLHHEGCEAYFTNILGDSKLGADASRVTGYVVINRALLNYGGHGTTIREQILAPGQYSTAYDVTSETADYCDLCLANAEWCLKYDCSSVISPSNNKPMPRNVLGQSGWCQCSSDLGKFNCWWWVDTNRDGQHTEYTAKGKPFDTFYCQNTSFPEE